MCSVSLRSALFEMTQFLTLHIFYHSYHGTTPLTWSVCGIRFSTFMQIFKFNTLQQMSGDGGERTIISTNGLGWPERRKEMNVLGLFFGDG